VGWGIVRLALAVREFGWSVAGLVWLMALMWLSASVALAVETVRPGSVRGLLTAPVSEII
jgi:hypothetical protein